MVCRVILIEAVIAAAVLLFVTGTLSATIQSQFSIWRNKPIPFIAADRALCSKLQLNRTPLPHLEQMVSPSTHEY